ncbi:hypothetical protein [Nitrosomonas aestuarii]|uniref:hypothetical protein n=1 Tax=Nitrosomonas aestuarii TaxID=52441 RepID=UPI000D4B1308|nr:hypothetical protein [Nitrosomonas aestuarii]PTN11826.1 hypothetical protein C8R11_107111 [Nitrosomonas aestuarii]
MKSDSVIHKAVSPFLDSQNHPSLTDKGVVDENFSAHSHFESQTPFFASYQELEGMDGASDPRQTEINALMSDLYVEEFNDEIYQLVAEASEFYHNRLPKHDAGDGELAERQAWRELETHFAPLHEDLEIILESMIGEVDAADLEGMSDHEKDLWVDSFFSGEGELEEEAPEIEHGWLKKKLRKARKKLKGIRKKVGKLVKKVGKKLSKPLLKVMLRRLKKFAKKLLIHVLQVASKNKRFPNRYRPLIAMLRKKLVKKEYADDVIQEEWVANSVASLQTELDYYLATGLLGEHAASGMEEELLELDSPYEETSWQDMEEARQLFVEQMLALEEHEDPAPHIEQFVTAILQAIRVIAQPVIAAVGRDKVIRYLAKYVSRITGKFIKKKNLNKLIATALVDVGLRLMKLEVQPEDEKMAAAEALAGVVEDTVMNSLQLPAAVFENEQLLEAEVVAAFEKAAADNLPPMLPEEIYRKRPHLRPSGSMKNAWVQLPHRKSKHRKRCRCYKKAIKSPSRRISAHTAKEIKTFDEVSLEMFLEEQLGIEIGGGLDAQIHLYEALPGTALFDIANQESYVPGLRSRHACNYNMLHPLTTHAAGLLLGEPALGRNVPAPYLMHRHCILPGQRFYFLEVPGVQPQTFLEEGSLRLRRPSKTKLSLDFIRNEIKIDLFISEKAAQSIAVDMREKQISPIASNKVVGILSDGLKQNFSQIGQNTIHVIHPSVIPGWGSGFALRRLPLYVIELLASSIQNWAVSALSKGLTNQMEQFVSATEHLEDGVMLRIQLVSIPGLDDIGKALGNVRNILSHPFDGIPGSARLEIYPGYV